MGKIVNNYELLEQLGQGGMGVVYKARHIHFDEIYAIKRLWEQYAQDKTYLSLFLNEANILRALNHKNIVKLSEIFRYQNEHFIVMEYVQGRTLEEIIKKEVGPIRRERAINLFKQMLQAVAYIHDQPHPVIHRDLKPQNIIVTKDDIVKITDFGIAKALEVGQQTTTLMKGTPIYMSPEQIINPRSVDIRTDVYSLGMTFYEMLCAKNPMLQENTDSPTAIYSKIMNDKIPSPKDYYPGVSDSLSAFVMKSICKDRVSRFQSVNAMLRELERLENMGATSINVVQPANQRIDAGTAQQNLKKQMEEIIKEQTLSVEIRSVPHPNLFSWSYQQEKRRSLLEVITNSMFFEFFMDMLARAAFAGLIYLIWYLFF